MNQLEYIPGIGGESVQLDGPTSFVGTAENLRSREWTYELGYRDLVSATRPAREVDVTFFAQFADADAFRHVADADVIAGTPGTFVAQNEWKQRGYVLASSPNSINYGELVTELKIALLDGAWWRLVSQEFHADDGGGAETYLDYPHDFPYDYSKRATVSTIEPSVLTPSAVHLVIYGPAINPYVIVGGNKYQVDITVPSGGYTVIDGRDKTIITTLADGTDRNDFAAGVRGSGQGGGDYVFEPIHAGSQSIAWDGTFGFDLGWYEEEGEPPWSQS